jgi:hypothetical protein
MLVRVSNVMEAKRLRQDRGKVGREFNNLNLDVSEKGVRRHRRVTMVEPRGYSATRQALHSPPG